MANRYIVWRKAIDPMVGEDPLVWEGSVFFQLWSRRVPPFGTLAEGDTVYLWDRSSNRVVWEWRIRCLLRTQYESRGQHRLPVAGRPGPHAVLPRRRAGSHDGRRPPHPLKLIRRARQPDDLLAAW